MPARWPTLDDEQRTSRFLTPIMYTGGQALEKREKTATLCHCLAGPELPTSVKARSPSRYKISRSDVTTIRPSRRKAKWQEPPPKLPLYSTKLYTISSPCCDEITANRPWGCNGSARNQHRLIFSVRLPLGPAIGTSARTGPRRGRAPFAGPRRGPARGGTIRTLGCARACPRRSARRPSSRWAVEG
jgi:hypothetical protein